MKSFGRTFIITSVLTLFPLAGVGAIDWIISHTIFLRGEGAMIFYITT